MPHLVLKRRRKESVIITTRSGETVEVCIERLRNCDVKLGFTAEVGVKIMRKEISGDPPAAAGPQPSSDSPEILPAAEKKVEV